MATRVLLADFQFLTRKAIASLIEAIPGFDLVKQMDDPLLLQKMVDDIHPDLVVVDLYGKEQELIAQIEQLKSNLDISFLVISNGQNRESIQRLLGVGVKGILTKNCSEEEITNGLIAVGRGSRFFCNTILDLVVQGEKEEDCEPTNLSPREFEVLEWITRGKTTAQIAEELHLSVHTINSHRKNILRKLNLNSPAELIVYALESGLVKNS